ncbi:MAG: hypothetical protein ACRBN8_42750 [Nannocystales bacterium]
MGMEIIDDSRLAVTFPLLHQLRIYDIETGTLQQSLEDVPTLAGLALESPDALLGAAPSPLFDPESPQDNGVWRIPLDGSPPVQLVALEPTALPGHVTILAQGPVLVSDLPGGRIFEVHEDEQTVSIWSDDPLLVGDPRAPLPHPPFPVGIEGMETDGRVLYGAVADHGRFVSIPINADGSAGAVEVLFEQPEDAYGLADFIRADDGSIYAGSGFQTSLFHIDSSGSVDLVGNAADRVDSPYALARRGDDLLFSNFGFISQISGERPDPTVMVLRGAFAD